jgi:hypothetical protein
MSITLQALQADCTWAVRNAFTTENAKVIGGSMKADDLETLARELMSRWNATMPGAQLRGHNSAKAHIPAHVRNEPAPARDERDTPAFKKRRPRRDHQLDPRRPLFRRGDGHRDEPAEGCGNTIPRPL